ncbi:MORC family CW-type Zinc finger protein 3 [Plakobranchus ocellatus]|uniref:MORC family CW-type Zinc finger protein 3 n=1 Tax=Plakobranchus ocellatus TaxID=259542 RepID=A0AAV4DDR0_9GAST|nr:MORC family CW-type Zinc finger protein 3 [Plakobranchus ocellatus]
MQKHLDAILKFSVYSDEEELKKELQALGRAKTGTKIVISNLSRLKNGNLELDFSSDKEDIRCCGADTPSEVHHTFEYRQSLREYCSLLYLKPRVKIIIRGKKVKSKLISKSLTHSRTDAYAPRELRRPVEITFGFSAKKRRDKNNCLMFYHENRLIKVFERPGYQGNPMSKWIHTDGYGTGLVGVASVDFLEPSNNKQDFVRDSKFTQTMRNIVLKLNKYWDEMEPVVSKQSNIRQTRSSIRTHVLAPLPSWTDLHLQAYSGTHVQLDSLALQACFCTYAQLVRLALLSTSMFWHPCPARQTCPAIHKHVLAPMSS